jgi:hypothetical protein
MMHIFGKKGVGKSVLAFQLAFSYVLKSGRSVFYLDTELGFNKAVKPHWHSTFCRRFGEVPLASVGVERTALAKRDRRVEKRELELILGEGLKKAGIKYSEDQLSAATTLFTPKCRLVASKAKTPAIFILECIELEDILAIHGVNAELIISEAGRVETRLKPGTQMNVKLSPLGQFCTQHDVGLIVYDSIGMPFKSAFVGTQDLPGRATAMNLWFGRAQMLCNAYDCAVIALNHETIVPVTQRVTYYGGGPVGFDFKYSFHLRLRDPKKGGAPTESLNPDLAKDATRVLWSQRFPSRADYGACVLLRLNEKGFSL